MNEFFWGAVNLAGLVVVSLILSAVILFIFYVLYNGLRALTITIWSCKVCKVMTGTYLHEGLLSNFFSNWIALFRVPSGYVVIRNEYGYWREWYDWKVYDECDEEYYDE